jgi:hypothetical protein
LIRLEARGQLAAQHVELVPRLPVEGVVARVVRSRRAGQALELRKAGLTFREIGRRMGFSEQRAHALVTEELARLNADRAEAAEAVTRLEIERLDALFEAVYPKAVKGHMGAVDRCLAIMARRAKMLGIDKEKGDFGGVLMQNVSAPVITMTAEERREALIAILRTAGQQTGPHSEVAELLALTQQDDAPLSVDAPALDGQAVPYDPQDGNEHAVPYGLKELPPADEAGDPWAGEIVRPLFDEG